MTAPDPFLQLVTAWQDEIPNPREAGRLTRILDHLRFLERVKFNPYVPALYSRHPSSFSSRLEGWLNNPGLSPAQQRDLFEFAPRIAFFSFDDFTAMFQNAFAGPISRWCMSEASIRLDQLDWQSKLDEARYKKTWFCPVTDSLLISAFHHVNSIEGKDRKPTFRDLMYFGDESADQGKNKIRKHIHKKGYDRLVLLEDFVGTGGQSFETVEWAVRTLKLPVLFCPMIVAPEAVQLFRQLKESLDQERAKDPGIPRFEFEPVFELAHDCFVHDADVEPEPLLVRVRALAEEIHERLSESGEQCKEGALGWWNNESPQKGATVVMFSNTPNNSLPLIHHGSDQWNPLFPRVARQPL